MTSMNDAPPTKPTQEWRSYWRSTFNDLEPDLLNRADPIDALLMVWGDWSLVLEYDGEIDSTFLLYATPSVARWSDGVWAVVQLSTFESWKDDGDLMWADMDVEQRAHLLADAASSAVVFETTLDVLEWARTPTAISEHPFEERSAIAAALVDLPLPEMREVRARLAAGASGRLETYLTAVREWIAQGEMFPVRVHQIPGQPARERFEPRIEYHLYSRDRIDGKLTSWSHPKIAAEADLEHVMAYAEAFRHDVEIRLVKVTTEPVPLSPKT